MMSWTYKDHEAWTSQIRDALAKGDADKLLPESICNYRVYQGMKILQQKCQYEDDALYDFLHCVVDKLLGRLHGAEGNRIWIEKYPAEMSKPGG